MALALLVAGASLALPRGESKAEAAGPDGWSGRNMNVVQQFCMPNGMVQVFVSWQPSGMGYQYWDVDPYDNNFGSGFMNHGPFQPNDGYGQWDGLQPGMTYRTRVNTWYGNDWHQSQPIAFTTIVCPGGNPGTIYNQGGYSAPSNVTVVLITVNVLRFQWAPGNGNDWYCLDTALNNYDLTNYTGSWQYNGCGNTANYFDMANFPCGQVIYFRVYGHSPYGNFDGHSPVQLVQAPACNYSYGNFSPPANVQIVYLGGPRLRFQWDRGNDNDSYCIDVARNHDDLDNYRGSFRNYGCGNHDNHWDVNDMPCGQDFYYRVYSKGHDNHDGYSPEGHMQGPDCR